MIKLCGFALSNYYNKVKLVLLEKGIPFTEELVWADRSPTLLESSPLGKIPFIETEQGVLCESQVIVDYLEAAFPEKPLMPADPFAAAKVRELIVFMELHLELVARELYGQAFFGGTASEETRTRVRKQLERNIKAFAKLVKFAPYVASSELTVADAAAVVHLPLVSLATKAIYGEDLLAALPVRPYLAMMGERETVRKVNQDRKENQALAAARTK